MFKDGQMFFVSSTGIDISNAGKEFSFSSVESKFAQRWFIGNCKHRNPSRKNAINQFFKSNAYSETINYSRKLKQKKLKQKEMAAMEKQNTTLLIAGSQNQEQPENSSREITNLITGNDIWRHERDDQVIVDTVTVHKKTKSFWKSFKHMRKQIRKLRFQKKNVYKPQGCTTHMQRQCSKKETLERINFLKPLPYLVGDSYSPEIIKQNILAITEHSEQNLLLTDY